MYLLKPDIIHPLDLLVKIEDVCFKDYPDDKFTREELQQYWERNQVILLEEGCLIFQPYPSHTNIHSIAVLPEYRRQGIARCLIEKLGNVKITLHCRETDKSFYEHLGFQTILEIPQYYQNNEKAYKMFKNSILDHF
jgi:ribosomal protein S18 acetylase RimI-like enzyme